MKTSRTNNSKGQEYLVMFRVYVQADGSMVVVIGNQRMEVTADEVHALLCGAIDYAKVFSKLHEQIDVTTLEILSENNTVVQPSVQTSTGVNGH
jgi:hypothetical protein